jgi:hypothetical protein
LRPSEARSKPQLASFDLDHKKKQVIARLGLHLALRVLDRVKLSNDCCPKKSWDRRLGSLRWREE